jgi:hypothetical protein
MDPSPGLTNIAPIRADLIDIVGTLVAVNRTLLALTAAMPASEQKQEALESLGLVTARIDEVLTRWGAQK